MRDTFNMATQKIYKNLTPLVDFFSKATGFIVSIAPIVICSLLFLVWHILSLLTCFILPYSFNFQTTKQYISASSQNIVNGLTSFFKNWLFSYFFYGVALLLTVPYLLAVGIYQLPQQLITLSKKYATIDNNVKQNKVNPSRSGDLKKDKHQGTNTQTKVAQKMNKGNSFRSVPPVDPTQNQKQDTGQKGKSIKKSSKLLDLIQNKPTKKVDPKRLRRAVTTGLEKVKELFPGFEDDCKQSILDACNIETAILSEEFLSIPESDFRDELKRQAAVDKKHQKAPRTDLTFLQSLFSRINTSSRVALHQSIIDSEVPTGTRSPKFGYSHPSFHPLYIVSNSIMTIAYLREKRAKHQLNFDSSPGMDSTAKGIIELACSQLDDLEKIFSDKEHVKKIFKLLSDDLTTLYDDYVNGGSVKDINSIMEGCEVVAACSSDCAEKLRDKMTKTLAWVQPNLSALINLSKCDAMIDQLENWVLTSYLEVLLSICQIKPVLTGLILKRDHSAMTRGCNTIYEGTPSEETQSIDSQSDAGLDTPPVQPAHHPGMASDEPPQEEKMEQDKVRGSFWGWGT